MIRNQNHRIFQKLKFGDFSYSFVLDCNVCNILLINNIFHLIYIIYILYIQQYRHTFALHIAQGHQSSQHLHRNQLNPQNWGPWSCQIAPYETHAINNISWNTVLLITWTLQRRKLRQPSWYLGIRCCASWIVIIGETFWSQKLSSSCSKDYPLGTKKDWRSILVGFEQNTSASSDKRCESKAVDNKYYVESDHQEANTEVFRCW